jgi:hypothetical protein
MDNMLEGVSGMSCVALGIIQSAASWHSVVVDINQITEIAGWI